MLNFESCTTQMRFQLASIIAAAALIAGAETQEAVSAQTDEPPGTTGGELVAPLSASEVLRSTIARFPVEPFTLSGSLIVRKQAGVIVREVPFTAKLNWGTEPATATYTIHDNFGRALNYMHLSRTSNGEIEVTYFSGSGNELPTPSLSASVAGTDISWLDITLSYLWWTDGDLKGEETFKGALCDIIEMRPPSLIPDCAAVRLWIDRKRGFMRQAEQINEKGERVRWMWVSSVGKINDRWMIKNLEVERPNTGLRTKLHIDDLKDL